MDNDLDLRNLMMKNMDLNNIEDLKCPNCGECIYIQIIRLGILPKFKSPVGQDVIIPKDSQFICFKCGMPAGAGIKDQSEINNSAEEMVDESSDNDTGNIIEFKKKE